MESESLVKETTSRSFEEDLSSAQVSVVDFWAPWCIPCKRMSEMLEEAASHSAALYGKGIGFFKVNVDQELSLAQKFGVMSLPTVMGFAGVSPCDKFTGRTKEDLVRWIERLAERLS